MNLWHNFLCLNSRFRSAESRQIVPHSRRLSHFNFPIFFSDANYRILIQSIKQKIFFWSAWKRKLNFFSNFSLLTRKKRFLLLSWSDPVLAGPEKMVIRCWARLELESWQWNIGKLHRFPLSAVMKSWLRSVSTFEPFVMSLGDALTLGL